MDIYVSGNIYTQCLFYHILMYLKIWHLNFFGKPYQSWISASVKSYLNQIWNILMIDQETDVFLVISYISSACWLLKLANICFIDDNFEWLR